MVTSKTLPPLIEVRMIHLHKQSSILQALIGEMRRTSGQVRFSGSVAYVPQVSTGVIVSVQVLIWWYFQRPWIRNASVRENITFGLPEDPSRYP